MYLYRYEDINPEHPYLILRVFTVVRATPCGFHIRPIEEPSGGKTRWVQDTSDEFTGEKRYAYRSLAHAWHSYCVRKRKQLQHLQRYLARTQEIVAYIDQRPESAPPPVPLDRATRGFSTGGPIRLRALPEPIPRPLISYAFGA